MTRPVITKKAGNDEILKIGLVRSYISFIASFKRVVEFSFLTSPIKLCDVNKKSGPLLPQALKGTLFCSNQEI